MPVPTVQPRTRWGLVCLLIASGVSLALHVGKVPPALPALRSELELGLAASGWLVSLTNLTGAFCATLLALSADRLGQGRLIVAGALLASLASLAATAGADISILLACRFLEGMGFMLGVVSIPPLVVRFASPRQLRFVLGLWSAYLPAGAGGIMIAASLLPADAGWRWLWYPAAAATLASATIMIATARRHRELLSNRLAPSVSFTGVREVLATPGVLLLGLCFALYAGAWYSVIGFLPVLQVERLEFDKSTAAFVTALVVFSNVAGNVCAGWLLQHGIRRILLLAGAASIMGASAAGLFLEVFPDGVRLALAFAFSMIGGLLPGCIFASVPRHCPRPALLGIAAGLVTQITNAGSLLGPPITGALVTRGGWPAAVWLTTGAFLLVIAASVLLHRIERHQDQHGIVAGGS